jgi:hypothetical protein
VRRSVNTQVRRVMGLVVVAMLVGVCCAPIASARAVQHRRTRTTSVLLHPRFHEVAPEVSSVASDPRYALVNSAASGMFLIDDQTGKRTTLTPPTMCAATGDLVGGGWVLTSCVGYGNPPYQLYSIATRTWTAVNSSGGLPGAIGSDWIEYYGPTEPGCVEHCSYQYSFGDITTGQLQTLPTWAPGATTIPDLNSTGLASPLCSPLQVPQGFVKTRPAALSRPINSLLRAGLQQASSGMCEVGSGNFVWTGRPDTLLCRAYPSVRASRWSGIASHFRRSIASSCVRLASTERATGDRGSRSPDPARGETRDRATRRGDLLRR